MLFSKKPVILDARGHLLGRLAATVAKTLLQGQKVIVVRCEGINISGKYHRQKNRYLGLIKKRCNVKPSRGPFHFRAPRKIFYRCVRGMIPHRTVRGKEAMSRLTVYEGIPAPYDKKKRVIIPSALRVIRLNPIRKYCELKRISHEIGWKYRHVIDTMEERRKIRSSQYFSEKKRDAKLKAQARKNVASKTAEFDKILASHGFN
ncbi:hypothetical protein SNE40_018856 [Patella caerulea]|uniref:Large ribosomal subunit protein uL13 n=1 Tax=Patella caerulea TaxID=87958 RepID=A0AAN8J654_PATCE